MLIGYTTRQATRQDAAGIRSLMDHKDTQHRHLDWRTPIDWLGSQPFWILEKGAFIQAALAFPADPPGVAWVRFFATLPHLDISASWIHLFKHCLQSLENGHPIIASVAVQPWYTRLLMDNQFIFLHTIVVLQLQNAIFSAKPVTTPITIRRMATADLEDVARVDNASFEPLWQNSLVATRYAFKEAGYATVALQEQQIVAYQISSQMTFSAHLSRLAVLPEMQGKGIGSALVVDMVRHYHALGISAITVNTQHNNTASLALYQKLGFQFLDERFPVLTYPVLNR